MQPELGFDRRSRQELPVEGSDIDRRHPPLHRVGLWILDLLRRHMTRLDQLLEMAAIAQPHAAPEGHA